VLYYGKQSGFLSLVAGICGVSVSEMRQDHIEETGEVTCRMPKKPAERFPGFSGSMALLRNRKDAEAQETGYHCLLPRVGEFVEPLLAELEAERDPYMQGWILELLGKARDVRAFHAFVRHLLSPDASVRQWAETALHQLGQTRAGRQVLWATTLQHEELPTLPTVRDEQFVREVLARVVQDLQEGSRGKPHKADRDA
jgi:hypothetical protein